MFRTSVHVHTMPSTCVGGVSGSLAASIFAMHADALRRTEDTNARAAGSVGVVVSSSLKHTRFCSFPTVSRFQYLNTAIAFVYSDIASSYKPSAYSSFPLAFAGVA